MERKDTMEPNVIGIGSTGCVIEHPVECASSNMTESTNFVAKIAPKENIKEELKKSERIRKIDPHSIFTIGYRGACVPKKNTTRLISMLKSKSCSPKIFKKKSKEKLYQLLMDYGGVAIDDLTPEIRIRYPPTVKMIPIVLTEVLRMLYAVYTLRNLHLSHYDIHSSNVLLNPDTMRLNLIDFGMLVEDGKIWEQFMRHNFMPRDYSHYPPELLIILWIVKYKPKLLGLVIDGVPDEIITIARESSRKNNPQELRQVLERSGIYAELGDFLLPDSFPPESRPNLYQIRCAGFLAIHAIVTTLPKSLLRKDKIEELLVKIVTTMDSYAMSSVLLKYISFIMLHRPYIVGDTHIQRTIKILESIGNNRLDERIGIHEGIGEVINIFKDLQSSNMKDMRKGVQTGELLRELRNDGIY